MSLSTFNLFLGFRHFNVELWTKEEYDCANSCTMKSSYTSTYYVCVLKLCYVACRRPVYVCAARLAHNWWRAFHDTQFLGYAWAVSVENRSSYEARDLRRKFAINCRGRLGFLFTLQKIAVSDPARGSNPTLLGQKRRVRPASWGWWFVSTLGKKDESDSPLRSNPRAGAKCKRGKY